VFFEAPHRVRRTIEDLAQYVKRPTIAARELTKTHEQLVELPNDELNAEFNYIGEFVLVVDGESNNATQEADSKIVSDMFCRLTELAKFDHKTAIDIVSTHLDVPAARVKNIAKKAKIQAKQRQSPAP
jgi:16S rRNA C1402 (ribose-2'-O) methylase RsmI